MTFVLLTPSELITNPPVYLFSFLMQFYNVFMYIATEMLSNNNLFSKNLYILETFARSGFLFVEYLF